MKTEYRGYDISYSENQDEWNCYDIGFSHEKLSRVKAKIDDMHRKLRKANAFHCLDISSHREASVTEATIVEYLGPIRKSKSFERVGTGEIEDHEVAYMSARTSLSERKSRHKGRISSLVLNTPGNLSRIDEARDLHEQAKALAEKARDVLRCLDRPTIEDIAGLVNASERRFDEAEQVNT